METKQTWKIGDCLDLLPRIPDKSIDMILTDLPYGTTACSWDTVIPFEPLWEQYKRIIKDNGAIVLTASQPFTSALIMSNIEMFKYCWYWQKSKGANFSQTGFQPLKVIEDICIFSKSACTYVKNMKNMVYNPQKITMRKPYKRNFENNIRDSLTAPLRNAKLKEIEYTYKTPINVFYSSTDGDGRVHPTQKPVALFEYLIKTYTKEGDTVHDSCLGSGTTLEACMNTNRNCIGFDLSDEWVPHYRKRLRLDNSKLTDGWNSGGSI